jgi:hypothetical protein
VLDTRGALLALVLVALLLAGYLGSKGRGEQSVGVPVVGWSVGIPTGWTVAALIAGGTIITAIELGTGGPLARGLSIALADASGIVQIGGIVGIGLFGYWFWKRFIKGQDTTVEVIGRRGD